MDIHHANLDTPYFIALSSEGIISGFRATIYLGAKVSNAGIIYKSNSVTLRHCEIRYILKNETTFLKYVQLGKFVFDFNSNIIGLYGEI